MVMAPPLLTQVAAADVYGCLTDGTPDEYNIYTDNWKGGEDLSFQTYRCALRLPPCAVALTLGVY